MSVCMGDVQAHLAFLGKDTGILCRRAVGCVCCSQLPGKLYPCIFKAPEGVAFLRSGKLGLMLLVVVTPC